MNQFSHVSRERLETCHPDLQTLMEHVLARRDISIVCGHRGQEEQDAAFDGGFSERKWPNSAHNQSPSWAVDIIPYPEGYKATDAQWDQLRLIIKEEAYLLGISIRKEISWDRPHVELGERRP